MSKHLLEIVKSARKAWEEWDDGNSYICDRIWDVVGTCKAQEYEVLTGFVNEEIDHRGYAQDFALDVPKGDHLLMCELDDDQKELVKEFRTKLWDKLEAFAAAYEEDEHDQG